MFRNRSTNGQRLAAPQLPSRLTPRAYVVSVRHGDDTVLLNAVNDRYYTLNRTGTKVWEWLSERVAPTDIVERLHRTTGVSPDVASTDLLQLLSDCASASLFEERWP